MLKNKINIVALLMVTIFIGCTDKSTQVYSVKLVHSGDLEFPLDNKEFFILNMYQGVYEGWTRTPIRTQCSDK